MAPDLIQELALISISAMQRGILMGNVQQADRSKAISNLFNEIESEHPSKSTEWLLQMTADTWNVRYGEDIDASDVITALSEIHSDD